MAENKELTLTRIYDAPREKVWEYWTNPELIQKWWGPKGVSNPTCIWEAKPEGEIHIVMLAGEELGSLKGQEWPMTGKFVEVQKPERLVFTANAIQDEKAILEHRTTVSLTEQDGKTHVTVHIQVTMTTPEAEGPLKGMEQGWNEQLDKLGCALK